MVWLDLVYGRDDGTSCFHFKFRLSSGKLFYARTEVI